jgi:hypothetical protein
MKVENISLPVEHVSLFKGWSCAMELFTTECLSADVQTHIRVPWRESELCRGNVNSTKVSSHFASSTLRSENSNCSERRYTTH